MIEFNLRVDSRITRAVAPVILQAFEHSREGVTLEYPLEGEDDQDLLSSWQNELHQDCKNDRASFKAMLQNHKFPHGYIEIAHEHADQVLRSATEVRMYIRNNQLTEFSDEELETGNFSLGKKSPSSQTFYLAYLVLAEIQEGLIQQLA